VSWQVIARRLSVEFDAEASAAYGNVFSLETEPQGEACYLQRGALQVEFQSDWQTLTGELDVQGVTTSTQIEQRYVAKLSGNFVGVGYLKPVNAEATDETLPNLATAEPEKGASLSAETALSRITAAAPGEVRTVCFYDSMPRGWVTIEYTHSQRCPKMAFNAHNAVKVKNTSGLSAGTVLSMCTGNLMPVGWVQTDQRYGGYYCLPADHRNTLDIKNLNGLPVGAKVTCCNNQPNPSGWSTIGYSTNYSKCNLNQANNLKIIQRVR
jgi:hypothetical protein